MSCDRVNRMVEATGGMPIADRGQRQPCVNPAADGVAGDGTRPAFVISAMWTRPEAPASNYDYASSTGGRLTPALHEGGVKTGAGGDEAGHLGRGAVENQWRPIPVARYAPGLSHD